MSTEEKVALVALVWEEYGLAPALAAVELAKSTWYYHRRHKVSYAESFSPSLSVKSAKFVQVVLSLTRNYAQQDLIYV